MECCNKCHDAVDDDGVPKRLLENSSKKKEIAIEMESKPPSLRKPLQFPCRHQNQNVISLDSSRAVEPTSSHISHMLHTLSIFQTHNVCRLTVSHV